MILCIGCVESDPTITYQFDPYAGDGFPAQRKPVTIPSGGMGIVTDSLSDSLSLLDLGAGTAFDTIPIGRNPVNIDGPHHLAVDPVGGFVYVALSYPRIGLAGPHASHGSATQPGYAQKLALDDFRLLGEVVVDPNPGDIVLSEDHSRLVVSHFDLVRAYENLGDIDKQRATLAVIDPASLQLTDSPFPKKITVCIAPHGVALSKPDGATAYVACYGEDVIAVVDLVAGETKALVPVSSAPGQPADPDYGPYSIIPSPDQTMLAIGNTVSNDIRFFDVATETVDPARTIPTLGAPLFLTWSEDASLLYVPVQAPDSVTVFDVASRQEVASRSLTPEECVAPHLVVLYGADTLLVVCEGDHKTPGQVVWLDRTTLQTKSTAEVGIYPDGLIPVMPGAP